MNRPIAIAVIISCTALLAAGTWLLAWLWQNGGAQQQQWETFIATAEQTQAAQKKNAANWENLLAIYGQDRLQMATETPDRLALMRIVEAAVRNRGTALDDLSMSPQQSGLRFGAVTQWLATLTVQARANNDRQIYELTEELMARLPGIVTLKKFHVTPNPEPIDRMYVNATIEFQISWLAGDESQIVRSVP